MGANDVSENNSPLTETEDKQWNHDALIEFPYDERSHHEKHGGKAECASQSEIIKSIERCAVDSRSAFHRNVQSNKKAEQGVSACEIDQLGRTEFPLAKEDLEIGVEGGQELPCIDAQEYEADFGKRLDILLLLFGLVPVSHCE